MDWGDVVRIGATLPGVEVSTSYGTPALKVARKLLTRLRPEDESLVVLGVPVEERETLIAAAPAIFHTTPHYDGYPAVLARLGPWSENDFYTFLLRRWRDVAPKRLVAEFDGAAPHGRPML